MKRSLTIVITALILFTTNALAEPVGTGFTYQGELNFQGAPANGNFDFEFNLFDIEIDGIALTDPFQLEDVAVQDGVFTVELDFGADPYTGELLWLDIGVKEGVSIESYTELLPRQKLTSSPYALEARLSELEAQTAVLSGQVATLVNLLSGVSRGIDPNTSQDTLTFTNMNVQIVNGSGSTGGTPDGTGNLIIGYNEPRGDSGCFDPDETGYWSCDKRGGSHNLVIGTLNSYASFGGLVAGRENEISGGFASVTGGSSNRATYTNSSVSGGNGNRATGLASSISGGRLNVASSWSTSISGGEGNIASGSIASISGGLLNTASGQTASVSGGTNNIASGVQASVSGGAVHTAAGNYCTVADNYTDC